MKKIIFMVLVVVVMSGCKGIITGHQYTSEEISDIAKFSSESAKRVRFALKKPKDINSTEVAKSFERIKKIKEKVKGLKSE
ncbi:hypothetical protein [Campylobacter sp. RM16192]|uniref:hypothetical protein n=1 Tax=Campylobacter sp. RM16192 TaxID=1660080 RepID=UPI0015534FFA|nr:hypothetical protein [Campylobacter sp. RM16192]